MSKKDNDELQTTFPEKWAKVLKELPEFKEAADASRWGRMMRAIG